MSGDFWKKHEDRYLRQFWPQGLCVRVIARHLGRTPSAVRVRASNLGLNRPSSNKEIAPRDKLTRQIWTHRTDEARAKLYAKAGRDYSPDNLRMRGAA